MKNKTLRELILGLNGTIVIEESKPKKVMKAINKLLNANTVEINILRETFATGEELEPYTDREWEVIYAMYSTTYGWDSIFELLTGNNPVEIQEEYFSGRETKKTKKLYKFKDVKDEELSKYKLVGTEYYYTLCKEILESKQTLSKHHKDILTLIPLDVLVEVHAKAEITFKETEVLVVKRLLVELDSDSEYLYRVIGTPNQIVRVIVSSYSKYTNDSLSELDIEKLVSRVNKASFKKLGLKVKLPNPIKRKLLTALDTMGSDRDFVEFKKYRTFWKVFFKQLMIKDRGYMVRKYPTAMKILDRLYSKDPLPNLNSAIEKAWLEGDLEKACKLEANNLGKLTSEKFLAYLRYVKGDTLARKVRETKVDASNLLDLKEVGFNKTSKRVVVKTDAHDYLVSEEFYRKLVESGNTKLLIKAQGLLKDARVYEYMPTRTTNKVEVRYEAPGLPPVRKETAKVLLEKLNFAISEIMREVNKDKGKIYIDSSIQGIGVPTSERTNNSLAISGIVIPKGGKIKLNLEGYENPVIRVALLWGGLTTRDYDLDLGVNIVGDGAERHCYWETGYVNEGEDIIASTSGDWVEIPESGFATEMIDININLCKKHGYEKIISSALTFDIDGNTVSPDVYLGVTIMEKTDRLLDNDKCVQLDLSDFLYMVKLTYEPKDNVLGHMINLVTGELEVYNENVGKFEYGTAEHVYGLMAKTLANRPMIPMLSDVLPTVFTKEQLVTSPEEADIIFGTELVDVTKEVEVINPLKDPLKLQEYLYN